MFIFGWPSICHLLPGHFAVQKELLHVSGVPASFLTTASHSYPPRTLNILRAQQLPFTAWLLCIAKRAFTLRIYFFFFYRGKWHLPFWIGKWSEKIWLVQHCLGMIDDFCITAHAHACGMTQLQHPTFSFWKCFCQNQSVNKVRSIDLTSACFTWLLYA